jgi:CRISPR-associated protein Csm3
MKLKNIIEVKGVLELLSGLHIGAGDSEMHIGGTDSPVIKNPHTNLPYIPGSSIKGKIRSLLEWNLGLVEMSNGHAFGHGHLKALANDKARTASAITLMQLFGISGGDQLSPVEAKELGLGLTRLAFRDCSLASQWVDDIQGRNLLVTEVKFENSINRISGTAESPRNFERVPAGALFEFVVNLKVLETDNEQVLMDMLLTGLKLLEMDALGGSGSRGYGRIKFTLTPELQQKFESISPFGTAA